MTEGDLYIDVQYNLSTGVYLRELADEIFDKCTLAFDRMKRDGTSSIFYLHYDRAVVQVPEVTGQQKYLQMPSNYLLLSEVTRPATISEAITEI